VAFSRINGGSGVVPPAGAWPATEVTTPNIKYAMQNIDSVVRIRTILIVEPVTGL